MRLAQAVQVGSWLLVGLIVLMSLGSIGLLMRMAPAMAGILERNERSLSACEEMLAALTLIGDVDGHEKERQRTRFEDALKRAEGNVTEKGEAEVLESIAAGAPAVFAGDREVRRQVVKALVRFGDINREAMKQADRKARQFGEAGIWGIVFMAICVFSVGLLFIRRLLQHLVNPMVELNAVIAAYRSGDTMRRCSGVDLPQDVRAVFQGINEILDQGQARILLKKDFVQERRQDQGGKEG